MIVWHLHIIEDSFYREKKAIWQQYSEQGRNTHAITGRSMRLAKASKRLNAKDGLVTTRVLYANALILTIIIASDAFCNAACRRLVQVDGLRTKHYIIATVDIRSDLAEQHEVTVQIQCSIAR